MVLTNSHLIMDGLENNAILFTFMYSGLGADDGTERVVRQCLEERACRISLLVDSSQKQSCKLIGGG